MKTLDDYKNFLAAFRKLTGIEAFAPDETGLVSVSVDDDFNLNLQFIQHSGKVLCFVEVCQLPHDAPREVYRELLAGCLFGRDTAGGYFSLEESSETVVYSYLFDGSAIEANPEELSDSLENIMQVCGLWRDRIKEIILGELPAGEVPEGQFETMRVSDMVMLHP